MKIRDFISKWKLLAAIVIIILSFVFGFISKILIFELAADLNKFSQYKVYFISWIIVYIASWFLVFIGMLLIGKEAYKKIQNSINLSMKKGYEEHVRNPVKEHINNPVKRFVKKARQQSKAAFQKHIKH